MKIIRFFSTTLALFLITTSAFARTTYANGSGHEMGYCSYTQGPFCIRDIEMRAERSGQDSASQSCRGQGGQPLTYTNYCSTNCYPNSIPPGESAWVSCNANCSMQCEIN